MCEKCVRKSSPKCNKNIVKNKQCRCKKDIYVPKVHYEDVKVTKKLNTKFHETTIIEKVWDVDNKPEVCHDRKPCGVSYEYLKTVKDQYKDKKDCKYNDNKNYKVNYKNNKKPACGCNKKY